MKTFNYKNYTNCYFNVDSYVLNPKAMAISIQNDTDSEITTCTIYEKNTPYSNHLIKVKNYSENSHLTDFLEELGIVIAIIDRVPYNHFVSSSIFTDNPQTIDTCIIDIDMLKKYTKNWNYNV